MEERLKVRVGCGYNARYNTHHRPDNVDLTIGGLTPLMRINRKLDSIALVGPGYDLIHSFNAIPLFTRTPFIVTFEDYCPRVPEDRYIGWLERWLRQILISDRCAAIVAMSEYGLRKFRRQHQHCPELANLLAKTHVVYPAVPAMATAPKTAADVLRLLFVGDDFMRKGGPAVIAAHRRLGARGIPVQTTVVSALRWDESDYIGPPDGLRCRALLDSVTTSGVIYYPHLVHADTTELMQRADYLLLPTLHDTFGYVSLEAMCCGTPAIATSTCAQNEIVEHGRSGFLLDFENDPMVGDWVWLYGQHRAGYVDAYWRAIQELTDELVEILSLAWERRKEYEALSAGAIRRVREHFNIDDARDRLAHLYQLAVRRGTASCPAVAPSD